VDEDRLGRLGDPVTDIAPAVVALATDLRFLAGATLLLDGGRVLLR
jgi:2-hydroxycyclohexanecarboxyl-CoA dehydrogenase